MIVTTIKFKKINHLAASTAVLLSLLLMPYYDGYYTRNGEYLCVAYPTYPSICFTANNVGLPFRDRRPVRQRFGPGPRIILAIKLHADGTLPQSGGKALRRFQFADTGVVITACGPIKEYHTITRVEHKIPG